MIVNVKFISIPDVDKREMSFEITRSDMVSMSDILKMVSDKTNVNFTKTGDRYMFTINSDFLMPEELCTTYINEGDIITIMPMLAGG